VVNMGNATLFREHAGLVDLGSGNAEPLSA